MIAQIHFYGSITAAVLCFLIGFFVFLKNPKSKLFRIFFFMNFVLGFWFGANAFSMYFFEDFTVSLLWFRIAYISVPFTSVAFYHYFVRMFRKKINLLLGLYAISITEVVFVWLYDGIGKGATAIQNVGIVWKGMPLFSYFLLFGMLKFLIITGYVVVLFYREYKKETVALKKEQLKILTILYGLVIFGMLEWLVAFNIPLHGAWMIIPFWTAFYGYVIINYGFMGIETIAHKTIAWVIVSVCLMIPFLISIFLIRDWLRSLSLVNITLLALGCFYLFSWIKEKIQPKIDHFFHKRAYDYDKAIISLVETVSSKIELKEISHPLLICINNTLYPKGLGLLIITNGAFIVSGSKNLSKLKEGDVLFDMNDELFRIFLENKEIIIKGRNENDRNLENWMLDNDIELLVPIIVKNEVLGFLCMGKKENLKLYGDYDLRFLSGVGKSVGVFMKNSLLYSSLMLESRNEREKIEKIVEERTAELNRKNLELTKFNKIVEERTIELDQQNIKLTRFNKIAVDRELKMLELKKEIRLLKEKLLNQ
ncbi:MAG: hypothetical protein KKD05_08130 [Candidatus Omnitrophica bacterium]|nr:hypothetical protein [Candidatus Omnitrophota bacterium]